MKQTKLNNSNEKTFTVHPYEQGTELFPFSILEETKVINEQGDTESTFEPIIGNTRIGETKFETKEEAKDYIASKPYELTMALVMHMIELHENFKNQQEILRQKQQKPTQYEIQK